MTKAYFNIEGTLGSQPPWGALLGARRAGCRELSVAFSTPTLIDLPHSSQPAAGGGGGGTRAGARQDRQGPREVGRGRDRLSLLPSFSSRPSQGALRAPQDPVQSGPGPLPLPGVHRLAEPGCPEA